MLIDPKELDAIKLETKKTFELVQFVDACEISPLYFDKPYYVVRTDELAQDAYRVVRDALRSARQGRVWANSPCAARNTSGPSSPAVTGCCWRRCATRTSCAMPTAVQRHRGRRRSDADLLEVATT